MTYTNERFVCEPNTHTGKYEPTVWTTEGMPMGNSWAPFEYQIFEGKYLKELYLVWFIIIPAYYIVYTVWLVHAKEYTNALYMHINSKCPRLSLTSLYMSVPHTPSLSPSPSSSPPPQYRVELPEF